MIAEVTTALVEHLSARTSDIGRDWVKVSSLEVGATLDADHLHICLYAIEEHPHLRNAPLVATADRYEQPPLGLRLQYVMAYVGALHLEAQDRLARVIQVFYSTPVLAGASLPPALAARVERLTVRLHSPGPDERSQLWTAFGRGQRLSVYYQVDVALIPPIEQEGHGVVREHRVDYAEATP
jgi:hypothetical protein